MSKQANEWFDNLSDQAIVDMLNDSKVREAIYRSQTPVVYDKFKGKPLPRQSTGKLTVTKFTIATGFTHGSKSYESTPLYKVDGFEQGIKDTEFLGKRLKKLSSAVELVVDWVKSVPDDDKRDPVDVALFTIMNEHPTVKKNGKNKWVYWIPNLYIHVSAE